MLEKLRKLKISVISAEESKILWPNGNIKYKNIFHFNEEDLEKIENKENACVIYINPLNLIDQKKIRGFAYKNNGYTFFRSSIWENKGMFNYFNEEFQEIPSPGYYLFYDIKGVPECKAKELIIENFEPISLPIASQAMFNYKHFKFKPTFNDSYFGISYHIAKYYQQEGLGLGIGEFAVNYLKIINFKIETADFSKKILLSTLKR